MSADDANSVWCTYGPAPNFGYVIAQDGTVVLSQDWLREGDIENSIQNLIP